MDKIVIDCLYQWSCTEISFNHNFISVSNLTFIIGSYSFDNATTTFLRNENLIIRDTFYIYCSGQNACSSRYVNFEFTANISNFHLVCAAEGSCYNLDLDVFVTDNVILECKGYKSCWESNIKFELTNYNTSNVDIICNGTPSGGYYDDSNACLTSTFTIQAYALSTDYSYLGIYYASIYCGDYDCEFAEFNFIEYELIIKTNSFL